MKNESTICGLIFTGVVIIGTTLMSIRSYKKTEKKSEEYREAWKEFEDGFDILINKVMELDRSVDDLINNDTEKTKTMIESIK